MQHKDITRLLDEVHDELFIWLENQDLDKWEKGPLDKWTTGQHILHLIQSVKPLNKAIRLPKFILAYKWGKNNRQSRDYESIKDKYKTKLAQIQGVVSPFSQHMPDCKSDQKAKFINKLNWEKEKLKKAISKWSFEQSNTYLIPHPLLGRMTVNEICIWTAIHVEHHFDILRKKYG